MGCRGVRKSENGGRSRSSLDRLLDLPLVSRDNRESFPNPKIADYLNEHFVCIEVDREERPDVDGVYINFVQQLTGCGG